MPVDTELDRYRRISRIGSGGMATVELAEDTLLGRPVALKRMAGTVDVQGLSRLRREALAGASMSHTNVVSVYDIVTRDDGDLVIVMEYVEGETLRDLIAREGALPPSRALPILKGAAAGFDAIHGAGIVHRDVKPSNILLGKDGAVKVADLGVASVPDRTSITTAGSIIGSLSYMAPEQLDEAPVTPAIDIYALAAVAFEMLSGVKARDEPNPVALAHAIATKPPPSLSDAWPAAPPAVTDLLGVAMSSHPRARPASAGELVAGLEEGLRPQRRPRTAPGSVPPPRTVPARHTVPPAVPLREPIPPREPPPPPHTRREPMPPGDSDDRSQKAILAAVALALLCIAVAVIVLISSGGSGSHKTAASKKKKPSHAAKTHTSSTAHKTASQSSSATASSAPAPASSSSSSSSSSTSSTPTTSSTPSSTSTSSAPGGAPAAGPAPGGPAPGGATSPNGASTPTGAVESFYTLAAGRRYPEAWALADPAFRNQLGGYQSFQAGQAKDRSITFNSARVTNQSATAATVVIKTTSVQSDATRHCRGTVDLASAAGGQWLLHQIDINCS